MLTAIIRLENMQSGRRKRLVCDFAKVVFIPIL